MKSNIENAEGAGIGTGGMNRKADAPVKKIVNILRDATDHSKLAHREGAYLLNVPWAEEPVTMSLGQEPRPKPTRLGAGSAGQKGKAHRLRMEEDEDFDLS